MSRSLSVTEPHPSVPNKGGYIGGGRGGAGNYQRYHSNELTSGPNATGPASRISLSKPSQQRRAYVPAGRGGAGNFFNEPEEAMFQFDEEMIRKREAQSAPIYHIGRGGAANWVDASKKSSSSSETASKPKNARKDSNASADSNVSVHSNGSTAQRVLSNIFGRRSS